MGSDEPDRVLIRTEDREIYDKLLKADEGPRSPLEGCENRLP